MRKLEILAILIIVVLAVGISTIALYDIFHSSSNLGGPSVTTSFPGEPVVDIIVPSLFKQGSAGGVNSALNLTRGETSNINIKIFPTISLTVQMSLQVYASTANENASNSILATFLPSQVSIAQGGGQNSTMAVQVSQTALVGQYRAVVTATNVANQSQYWGDIFQINVLQ